ncbi:MAG: CADD family putative folate metabolism protein [Verrucomicrobiota bacterium]|nr:CADD family putative folate metabolism protein [Verrucomicrobiota bacterium]
MSSNAKDLLSAPAQNAKTAPNIIKAMNDYLAVIDAQIAAKHLLTHPFYLAWTRGELSKAALQDYAQQYYHHVAAFPTYLSALHSNCDDQTMRREILKNLHDEEAGQPNHPELWLQFADSLGAERGGEKQPETVGLIDTFRDICRNGATAEGLAALYAYESQIPSVSESKIDGLKKHYGLTNPETYEYFSVHVKADRAHSAAEREMLRAEITDDKAPGVMHSIDRVLDALWALLSGVCQRHAIAC